MARDKTARLRMDYTGEPYSSAFQWFRSRGLFNGLVPDAASPQQQLLEACVLQTLARPAPGGLPYLAAPGTAFGLEGVSPDFDVLLLRPAGDLVAQVLARILPAAAATGVTGVPGLRAQVSRRSGLTVGRIGERAVIEVQSSLTGNVRAAQKDLHEAAELVTAAGLTPLWTNTALAEGESEAWHRFCQEIEDAAPWSTALRRIGLFVERTPDWTRRPPAPQELAGPKPDRIRPRSVGPGSRVTGVVAVAPGMGRGGVGCTTAVVALAGALARSGVDVGVLSAADNPNRIRSVMAHPAAPGPDGWWDLVAIEGAGTIRAADVPGDADAHELIERARTMFDVVIVDIGNGGYHSDWCAFADMTVGVVLHKEEMWAGKRLVDRRPDSIRFFAWLNDQFNRFRTGGRLLSPLEKMLNYLDEEFLFYVTDRESDGEPMVYDASNPEDVEQWWSSYAFADQIGVDEDEEGEDENEAEGDDGGLWLPAEHEAPYLDQWREEFLSFLAVEGRRRHENVWDQAAQQWAARNKARNLKGLQPGEREVAHDASQEFASAVEDDAVTRWGLEMWRTQFPVWEAAREAGDDLIRPWGHLLETVALPHDPSDIAGHLRQQLHGLPDQPTVVVLARAENRLGADRLTSVRDELMDDGYRGLVILPELRALAEMLRDVETVAKRGGEAAGAANRLAHVVANTLRETAARPANRR
ncbi:MULTISPECIES: hypothetical protein [Streptomyces]|uniref:hypothetical protein n=1 Tax=Streptomyces TaxID=1883 RepID=UPI001112C226|nr:MULTISPECIES: hypothetical protein [Streptomyces]MDT9700178.1 hypothetical protein [Streptomyces sp. P17]